MTQHELESIIRLVPSPSGAKGCAHVRLDKRGKAIPAGGAFSSVTRAFALGGPTYLYEIKLDESLEIYDSRQLLKAFITNEETNIDFRVRIIARSRNLEKIAETLHDRLLSPADILFETLNKVIKSILEKKLLSGPESIADHILTSREEWQNAIADRIEDLLGLETQIIFEGTQVPRTKKIRVEAVATRFKDAPHRDYPLTISATFDPTGDRALETFPQTQAKQTTFLRDIVLEACLNDVTLYDYWFNRHKIENGIRQRLDRACRHFAYRSGDIVVETRADPGIKPTEQIALVIPWAGHRNRNIDFNLDTMMTLKEDGGGLYDSLGRPDRRQWLAAAGAAALRAAMHGRDFYDLTLSEQDALEQKIREILTLDASRIGHAIEPVVARVMLAENRWLDKQIMEVEGQDYPLKNQLVSARLGATITIKFSNIRPLVNYVDQQKEPSPDTNYSKEIEDGLKQLVRKTISIVMRETETNDYFATWEKWEFPFQEDDHVVSGHRNYVRNQLIHAIRKELSQRFVPDVCDVRLHRDNGQLGEIIDHLKKIERLEISGEVIPDDAASDAEFVPYSLVAHVDDVQGDQWANVLRRGIAYLSAENLTEGLRAAVDEFLRGRLAQDLEELNYGRRATPGIETAKHALEDYVNQHMRNHYGLICHVERVTISRSARQKAQDTIRGLPTRAALTEAERMRQLLQDGVLVDKAMYGQQALLIQKLNQSILNNPRETEDDLLQYSRDTRELENLLKRGALVTQQAKAAMHTLALPGSPVAPKEAEASQSQPDVIIPDGPHVTEI